MNEPPNIPEQPPHTGPKATTVAGFAMLAFCLPVLLLARPLLHEEPLLLMVSIGMCVLIGIALIIKPLQAVVYVALSFSSIAVLSGLYVLWSNINMHYAGLYPAIAFGFVLYLLVRKKNSLAPTLGSVVLVVLGIVIAQPLIIFILTIRSCHNPRRYAEPYEEPPESIVKQFHSKIVEIRPLLFKRIDAVRNAISVAESGGGGTLTPRVLYDTADTRLAAIQQTLAWGDTSWYYAQRALLDPQRTDTASIAEVRTYMVAARSLGDFRRHYLNCTDSLVKYLRLEMQVEGSLAVYYRQQQQRYKDTIKVLLPAIKNLDKHLDTLYTIVTHQQ